MGITKTEGFTLETNKMAELLKVLGHPARLSIVQMLAKSSDCVGNEFVAQLPLAQPTISRHLAELKKAELIQGSIAGKNISYCINPKRWNQMQHFLNNITLEIQSNKEQC
jgi:predicted transcriptional regulator